MDPVYISRKFNFVFFLNPPHDFNIGRRNQQHRRRLFQEERQQRQHHHHRQQYQTKIVVPMGSGFLAYTIMSNR